MAAVDYGSLEASKEAEQGLEYTAVNSTLASVEMGMDVESTTAVFEELRKVPPTVAVVAEAYHTELSHMEGDTGEEVIDHTEKANFSFTSWQDVSGHVAGLDEYRVASVEVVPTIKCADVDTTDSLRSLTETLLNECRRFRNSVRSCQNVSLAHPKFRVDGRKIFVTSSAGEKPPSWMKTSYYTACRFACPGLGTVYRVLLFTSLPNLRYTITKHISVLKQGGAEWQDA